MTHMGNRLAIVIGVAACMVAALGLPGCSEVYEVEVRGTVTNAADGKPLAGVMVWLPPALGTSDPVFTGEDGKFAFEPRWVRSGAWSLTLTRDGLAEVVDIDPGNMPSGKATTLIVVVASMRVNP